MNSNKQGCFYRDPYLINNTFINSGSFIIKINEFIKKMYDSIINEVNNNSIYHNSWPYDQYYISKYIFENKNNKIIFVPHILNTPLGQVLRHNWQKNNNMYNDLLLLQQEQLNIISTNIEEYYDKQDFSNIL